MQKAAYEGSAELLPNARLKEFGFETIKMIDFIAKRTLYQTKCEETHLDYSEDG